jgi:hypothetical protein
MILHSYRNGNADIQLHSDGTRIIEFPEKIRLEYPLNIDIRISSKCAFGLNPKTGKAICDFCHESATTDGADADFEYLEGILNDLPRGIELAVGVNHWTFQTIQFLVWCKRKGFVVNATVNQGHLRRDRNTLLYVINAQLINGLGISYRNGMIDIDPEFLEYTNTVVHVIAGLDSIDAVSALKEKGVKKILVLGEKDFGFNIGKVKLTTSSHREWYRRIHELFKQFDVVSFDNLALEQLNVKRFVMNWQEMYQHEYSFYINAVDKYYAPSSRSSDTVPCSSMTVRQYFQHIFPEFSE